MQVQRLLATLGLHIRAYRHGCLPFVESRRRGKRNKVGVSPATAAHRLPVATVWTKDPRSFAPKSGFLTSERIRLRASHRGLQVLAGTKGEPSSMEAFSVPGGGDNQQHDHRPCIGKPVDQALQFFTPARCRVNGLTSSSRLLQRPC